jgi:nitroreductase
MAASRAVRSATPTAAILSRFSCRAFLDTPVREGTVRELIGTSTRAASGGNLQPWRVYVATGEKRDALVGAATSKFAQMELEEPAYDIYPETFLREHPDGARYMEARRELARDMYGLMGVGRKDRAAKLAAAGRNWEFFGAPVGIILTIDRRMGPPQWADLGIFLQTLGVLARERGLHTCYQEAWAQYPETVARVLGVPAHETVFCGVALGHADLSAPVNRLQSKRFPVDEVATFFFDGGQSERARL